MRTKDRSYSLARIKCDGCGESAEIGDRISHPVACSQYVGFCHCGTRAFSLGYDENTDALVPVCSRHIRVSRVGLLLWQAEDDYAGLPSYRRSMFRRLAQLYIVEDQRMFSLRGELSPGQRRGGKRSFLDPLHLMLSY